MNVEICFILKRYIRCVLVLSRLRERGEEEIVLSFTLTFLFFLRLLVDFLEQEVSTASITFSEKGGNVVDVEAVTSSYTS